MATKAKWIGFKLRVWIDIDKYKLRDWIDSPTGEFYLEFIGHMLWEDGKNDPNYTADARLGSPLDTLYLYITIPKDVIEEDPH